MNEKYMRTEDAIFNTVISLLNGHDKDELTIKEVCIMTGISRTTFYSHFESMEDVYSAMKKKYIRKEFYERNELLTKESRREFVKYLKDNRQFFHIYPKLLDKAEMSSLFLSAKAKIKEYSSKNLDESKLLFLTSGYISCITKEMIDSFSEPTEKIEEGLENFIKLLS